VNNPISTPTADISLKSFGLTIMKELARTPNWHRAKTAQQECGWKGGDRGGLAERRKMKKVAERKKNY
jgi:hypothetical protein